MSREPCSKPARSVKRIYVHGSQEPRRNGRVYRLHYPFYFHTLRHTSKFFSVTSSASAFRHLRTGPCD